MIPKEATKMTEPSAEDDVRATERSLFDQEPGVDWFLAYLVNLTDDTGITMGMTLTVGGNMVRGTLISGREYFAELGQAVREGNFQGEGDGRTVMDTIGRVYSQFGQIYPQKGNVRELGNVGASFIHLRGAQHLIGTGEWAPTPGTLWRGKLASVDGYILGN
jgi:hypothetical protein